MKRAKFRKVLAEKVGRTDANAELCRLLGISPNTASARLLNRRPFQADELEIIRKEYDLSADELVDIFIKEGE